MNRGDRFVHVSTNCQCFCWRWNRAPRRAIYCWLNQPYGATIRGQFISLVDWNCRQFLFQDSQVPQCPQVDLVSSFPKHGQVSQLVASPFAFIESQSTSVHHLWAPSAKGVAALSSTIAIPAGQRKGFFDDKKERSPQRTSATPSSTKSCASKSALLGERSIVWNFDSPCLQTEATRSAGLPEDGLSAMDWKRGPERQKLRARGGYDITSAWLPPRCCQ